MGGSEGITDAIDHSLETGNQSLFSLWIYFSRVMVSHDYFQNIEPSEYRPKKFNANIARIARI